jgi:signal-transduction protein with cAMP-binding, CBS, and nucleotidyltransferase domain
MWGSIIREPPASRAQLFAGLTDQRSSYSFMKRASTGSRQAKPSLESETSATRCSLFCRVAKAIVVEDGGHRLFRGLQHGDVFGEVAMFLNSVRPAYVRAITDVEVLVISKEQLNDSLTTMPRIASRVLLNLVRCLCGRLVENTEGSHRAAIEDAH